MKGWRCRGYDGVHSELPMHYGALAPALWFTIPEAAALFLAAQTKRGAETFAIMVNGRSHRVGVFIYSLSRKQRGE